MFVPERATDNATARNFYIFFRTPQISDYLDLMHDSQESENINTICQDWSSLPNVEELPLRVQEQLASKQTTLQQVIDTCSGE